MKGQITNCKHCGKPFVKKKDKHFFCKTSHRVTYHKKSKGVKEQSFKTAIGETVTIPQPKTVKAIEPVKDFSRDKTFVKEVKRNFSSVQNTTPERQLLLSHRNYWQNIYNGTFSGKMPSWMLIGAGTGLLMSEEKNRFENAFKGFLFGALIDGLKPTQEETRSKAMQQIEMIDKKLKDLQVAELQISNFINVNNFPTTTPKKAKSRAGITSGAEYQKAQIDTFGIKGKYLYLFGDASPGFFMLLSGKSGNGKTTFAVGFAQYLEENHGRVLFLTYEQKGKNKPFQELLKNSNGTFSISEYPPKDLEDLNTLVKDFDFIVIDSINYAGLTPSDIEKLREENPTLSIVGIAQSTKNGEFKGSNEYLHNCDIHIKAVNGVAEQYKSRYAKGEANVQIWT